MIWEFEKLPYKSYEKKRPKYEPPDSYFYLSRQLEKCMMKADALNSHVYHVRTEINAPSSHVYFTDEDESKRIIPQEILSQSCSTDKDESKLSIFNKNLSQNCSADEDELIYTEEDKPECTITKKKTQ